jgi:hypothetical protein
VSPQLTHLNKFPHVTPTGTVTFVFNKFPHVTPTDK